MALVIDKDIVGLDIAVDDAQRVGVVERGGHIADDAQGVAQGQGAAGNDILDRPGAHVAHDQVQGAILLAGIIHRHDIAVLEPGDDARLLLEALYGQ